MQLIRRRLSRRRGALRLLRVRLGELRRDRSGVSLLELALVLPVLLTLGLFGTEVAYMTVIDMQMSMIATAVADNASRLGQTDNSSVTPTVTEQQIASVMAGALAEGDAFDFADKGRVILSSLERNASNGRQYIHWQRCAGELDVESHYGPQGTGANGILLDGMGRSGHLVRATNGVAVMYVEVFYHYEPLFGQFFTNQTRFYHEAAFMVRDDRNMTPGVTGGGGVSSCS